MVVKHPGRNTSEDIRFRLKFARVGNTTVYHVVDVLYLKTLMSIEGIV